MFYDNFSILELRNISVDAFLDVLKLFSEDGHGLTDDGDRAERTDRLHLENIAVLLLP